MNDHTLSEGHHTLSVLAYKSGLRIDRLFLTTSEELPPVDAAWQPSPRTTNAAPAVPDMAVRSAGSDPATVRQSPQSAKEHS